MKAVVSKMWLMVLLTLPLLGFSPKQDSVVVNEKGKIEISKRDYNNMEIEMADGMRSEGKIYVVVAVVLSITLGILAYLFVLDRKVTRMERSLED